MRARVLAALAASPHSGLSAEIRTLRASELGGVREAFLTNVRWGIRSIGVLDGRPLGSDDYAQRLRRLIDAANI
jgi:branched-subunit amino acid aminotransferase/4-amino-4-deoxychorismate lyase